MNQEQQLLAHFEKVPHITADQARNVLLIRRLGAVIYRLKAQGYAFNRTFHKDSTGRTYVQYRFLGRTSCSESVAAFKSELAQARAA